MFLNSGNGYTWATLFPGVHLKSPIRIWLELRYWCLCHFHHSGTKVRGNRCDVSSQSGCFNSVLHPHVFLRRGLKALCLMQQHILLSWPCFFLNYISDSQLKQWPVHCWTFKGSSSSEIFSTFPWLANEPDFSGEWCDKSSTLSKCVGGMLENPCPGLGKWSKHYGFVDWVRRKMGEWTKILFQNKELMKFKVYLHEMEPCIFLLLFMCGKNNENEIYSMITCYETLMRVTNISTQTKISFSCKKKKNFPI